MYRQSSHISRSKSFLPSPTPDELSEPDSDLIAILEEKRREIDAEIEAYRLRKEEEFEKFEDELRSRKRRNASVGIQQPTNPQSELSKLHIKDATNKDREKKVDHLTLGGLKPTTGPSKAVVSVERVTINGMTTPPVSGSPPLARTLSRSPPNLSITPPRASSRKEFDRSPTTPDREKEFRGLFTPGFLQLLDTKPSSLPPKPTSPSLTHSKRSLTIPTLPSNSLPSALRTASGTVRKRKHVTFRLAHSVVVEPSSSYEETPSPSEDHYDDDLNEPKVDLGIDVPPNSLRTQSPYSDLDEGLRSPDKSIDEANFFSFDEELGDTEDDPLKYRDEQDNQAAGLDNSEQQPDPSEVESLTFASGSLPIDIVKPSSSFQAALRG